LDIRGKDPGLLFTDPFCVPMKRRKFLAASGFAGLAAATAPLEGCTSSPQTPKAAAATPDPQDFPWLETTIDDLQRKMADGSLTARQLTEDYLQRIVAFDPQLKSVIETNPDALAMAAALDQERNEGKLRGPLHGIPVLVKDNIDTGDQMMTTAGSLALEGNKASKDAFIVARLREAGAVLLGKTNLSEWANFRSTRSTSGWSSRGGQVRNPYILDRSPSGSSSGTGAAVAANFCAVGIGTETDGSVIAPSSANGLVGIKPTVGLLSRQGIIPISHTQDTAGPMARTVKDVAILLGALVGTDPNDPATVASEGKTFSDYTAFLDADSLKGKRIGVEQALFQGHREVVALYKAACQVLEKLGATVVEVGLLSKTRDLRNAEYTILQYEFKHGVNQYLAAAAAPVKSLAEVIAFNQANASRAMPFFQQETLEMCQAKGPLTDKEYQEALAVSTSAKGLIDGLLQAEKLDALFGVSIGFSGCIDLINGDYSSGFYFCSPAAMAGYPHVTVPMGQVHGLPVGCSFVASAWQEPVVLAFAYAFEQATRHRKAPTFRKDYLG
jgi:amidase